jgi:DNA-binding IclR family transcriptional regulator
MAAETSQTLDRGLRVLEVVAESPDGLTVTELAAALGIGRTVVYRLVVTLEQHAFLRRSTDGKCRLGLGVLAMGRQVQPIVRDTAMPALRLLADAVNATAVLTVVDGPEALAAVVVEPSRSDLHVASRSGARYPLEHGAAGRAILAARTTAGRPLDPPWVVATGDGPQGAYGIAVPVLGVPGLEASVSVLALRELNDAEVGPRVARAAGEIARALR